MYKLCVVRSVVSVYIRARNEPLRSLKFYNHGEGSY